MTLTHTVPDAVPPRPPSASAVDVERFDGGWTTQRVLRAEKAQVTRWRRLLRARLDLTVAGFAPPEALGLTTWGTLPDPITTTADLPCTAVLQAAVAGMTTADPVELMTHLRDLDRALGRYDLWVDGELESSLQESLTHIAGGDGR